MKLIRYAPSYVVLASSISTLLANVIHVCSFPLRNQVVKARHPFAKDPDIDYEMDSDEKWEEDEPGESLSDCDKDDEDEIAEGHLKGDDENESEDGFFVPDGYLSENEGVQADEMESDELVEETTFSPAEELTGIEKLERLCLQTLSIRPLPDIPSIEISVQNDVVDNDVESSSNKSSPTLVATAAAMLDCNLPQIVKKEILSKLGLSISPEKKCTKAKSIITFFSKRCLPPSGKTVDLSDTSPQPSRKHAAIVHPQQDCAHEH
ncbi:UNVERIFIED_CONTAM: Chromatin assembly factor 1 subunit FSM [Sesamum latifolium]|uniref:Chromatin assembly factor 1 subunit FSM n=1 Tax=Sesamum latifolium TaxID=2727402 RepID=A0AAW2TG38_9LAMI